MMQMIENKAKEQHFTRTILQTREAMAEAVSLYEKLGYNMEKYWSHHSVFYGFCPDHGCHLIDGNRGSHGLDMEEDMNVIHFYGFIWGDNNER